MLNGKHALRADGSTGIGLAMARILAQAGTRVTIAGHPSGMHVGRRITFDALWLCGSGSDSVNGQAIDITHGQL